MRAQPAPIAWQPILEGSLAERAHASAREVIAALGDPTAQTDAGLAGGAAGLALVFAYVGRAWNHPPHLDTARRYLERATDALTEQVLPPSLYSGFVGIAWAHHQLERLLYGESDGDAAAELDDALVLLLQQQPWYREYDLISGLVGFGLFALERLPRPRAIQALELLLARLDETSETTPQGITWHTRPYLLPEHQRREYPDGYHNLGLAHGVPAVVAFLAAVVARGLGGELARRLLDGGLAWLHSQKNPDSAPGCFGVSAEKRGPEQATRLAWCYGDAGIAVALLAGADSLGHQPMRQLALEVARKSADRKPGTAGVVDPGVCHGAAGLAHCFNRLYQATHDPRYLEVARDWCARTLELRREESSIAGYSTWEMAPDGKFVWSAQAGMLVGAAGVAATLVAATSPIPPDWDRFLMMSLPPVLPASPATSGPSAHGPD